MIDIAIGAPLDGIDGRGAVYIFNGGAQGISLIPNQVSCVLIFKVSWNLINYLMMRFLWFILLVYVLFLFILISLYTDTECERTWF